MPTATPTFRELTRDECVALLDRHQVGRLAFSQRERLDIEPIHYVHLDGWLYGRTQPGTKLEVLLHNRWVAFEVDEVDALFEWRSVVVKGGLYLLRPAGSDVEQERYAQGVAAVRRLVPEAFTAADPIPERAVLFRIHVDELSGRAATTA